MCALNVSYTLPPLYRWFGPVIKSFWEGISAKVNSIFQRTVNVHHPLFLLSIYKGADINLN